MLNGRKGKGNSRKNDGEHVAKNFVRVYYGVMNSHPEQLYHFYGDGSTTIVSEIEGSNSSLKKSAEGRDKIRQLLGSVFKGLTAKVKTALPQFTVEGGLLLLVSGTLTKQASTSIDGGEHCFTQALVLAPQENGYYVLNDTIHIMSSLTNVATPEATQNDRNAGYVGRFYPQFNHSCSIVPPTPRQRGHYTSHQDDRPSTPSEANKSGEIKSDSDSDDSSDRPPNPPRPASQQRSLGRKGQVNKPYSAGPAVSARSHHQNGTPVRCWVGVPQPQGSPAVLQNTSSKSSETKQPPVPPGHGVFIARLPFGIQAEEVERAFAVFGPVLNGAEGIQVRDGRNGCYAFVTFESTESAETAIEKGAIVGGKRVYVEPRYPRQDTTNQSFTSSVSVPVTLQHSPALPQLAAPPAPIRLAPPMMSPPIGPN